MKRQPIVFRCQGIELVGVIDLPVKALDRGIVIVTGGPQYRVGSHRQFVSIAHELAAHGYPVLRFDYRGMGDSDGDTIDFHQISPDIRAAVDALVTNTGISQVVLWGLCDAASASLIYARSDARVNGMVLLNPWVRTEAGLARTYVKHYYFQRLISRDFWRKVASGQFAVVQAGKEFFANAISATTSHLRRDRELSSNIIKSVNQDFRERMRISLAMFDKPVLFLLSGDDLTAAEFVDYARSSSHWCKLLARHNVTHQHLNGMDHTFSTARWRKEVIEKTLDWLSEW